MGSSVGHSPVDGTISLFDCKPKEPAVFLCSIWFVVTNREYSSQQTPSNADLPPAAVLCLHQQMGAVWCKCRELLE